MANRRMLNISISYSKQVNALPSEFARLLFSWTIPHLDDFGRIDGDPQVLKARVMPMSERTIDEFETAIQQMISVGLIKRYEADGRLVIEYPTFARHQEGLHKRTKSKYPDNPNTPKTSGKFSEVPGSSSLNEENRTEENLTEANKNKYYKKSQSKNQKRVVKFSSLSSLSDITEAELQPIADQYKVPLVFVYSKIDDLHNYCESNGKTYQNYLAALRNFVKNDAIKIRKEAALHESKRGIDARHIK